MKNFDEASNIWKSSILNAMESYDDYDPELIRKLQRDWEDLLKRIEENQA